MTEVLFYHLTQNSLQQALPGLLERCLERDWKATVQAESESQRDMLDGHLWSYRDDSFLPHGVENGKVADPEDHPIWLTITTENPNNSSVRFVVGVSVPSGTENYQRVIYIFDGNNDEEISAARERWKIEKRAGHELTYWQQDDAGRWQKSA
jgi:DNA polymerase-3 subunit chi